MHQKVSFSLVFTHNLEYTRPITCELSTATTLCIKLYHSPAPRLVLLAAQPLAKKFVTPLFFLISYEFSVKFFEYILVNQDLSSA